jgi:hypothetical protein
MDGSGCVMVSLKWRLELVRFHTTIYCFLKTFQDSEAFSESYEHDGMILALEISNLLLRLTQRGIIDRTKS